MEQFFNVILPPVVAALFSGLLIKIMQQQQEVI
jgi:hypothetical protein